MFNLRYGTIGNSKLKKNCYIIKKEMHATGGGNYKQLILSSLEETVSNIICLDAVINPTGISQGIPTAQNIAPAPIEYEAEVFNIETPDISELIAIEPNFPEDIESSPNELPTSSKRSLKKNQMKMIGIVC